MRLAIAVTLVGVGFAQAQTPAPMHLTLAEAQRLGTQNNPRNAAAQFRAAAAHQVAPQYRAAREPNVFGSLTGVGADNGSRLAAGGLNNPVVYDRVASGLTASQLITDFGRIGNLIGMANLQAQAQDQAGIAARAAILLGVSQAYFDLLRAHAVMQVADQTVSTRQAVADQVTELTRNQLRSTLDASFANVNLADAKLLQAQARNQVQSAEAELAAAMGLPNSAGFVLEEEADPGPLVTPVNDLIGLAMRNRPELKDLQLQLGAAQRFTKAERDLYYPTVSIVGTAGFAPAGETQIASRYGAIGLNVNIPVLSGGLFKARETEAALKAKAAERNVDDLANVIHRDVRVAYLNASTAYERLGLTQQLLDQAKLALDLSQTRYENGLGSIVEVSQAQLAVTAAQIQNASAKYDYQAQRVGLDYQTGVLR